MKRPVLCKIWHHCYFSDTKSNQDSFMTEDKMKSIHIINSFIVLIELMVIKTLQFEVVCKFPNFAIKLI